MSVHRPRTIQGKSFLSTWLAGYVNPSKMAHALAGKPAPQWGLYAQFLHALLDSLFLYLPLSLMDRAPSTPSYLTLLPTESYYLALALLAPLLSPSQWLLLSSVAHVILRLLGRHLCVHHSKNGSCFWDSAAGAFRSSEAQLV